MHAYKPFPRLEESLDLSCPACSYPFAWQWFSNSGLLPLRIQCCNSETIRQTLLLFLEVASSWMASKWRLCPFFLWRVLMSCPRVYRFYGTNAYWLQMATDYDIDLTFHDIATTAFRVVRTWAFNDVPRKPASGTYFQVLLSCYCFAQSFVYWGGGSKDSSKWPSNYQWRSRWSTEAWSSSRGCQQIWRQAHPIAHQQLESWEANAQCFLEP